MQFDIILPGTNRLPGFYPWSHELDSDGFRRILATADEAGFRGVAVSEHLAMPHHEVPRLGSYWQDALTVAAFAAAATRRIRLDFAVLVLPLHHPLRLAKALGTIDVLSAGRLDVSIGVGHAESEFAAVDIPFERRGAITDEILVALTTLWTQEYPAHRGARFTIEGLAIEPTPLQKPHPPIYVGGNSKPALRRAARHDGWQPNPTDFSLEMIPPLMDYVRARPEFTGKERTFDLNWIKSPAGVELSNGFAQTTPTALRAYRDQLVAAYLGPYRKVGITRTVAESPPAVGSEAEYCDYLRWFASEVMSEVDGSPRL
ncbi:TIGR03619 family F420-dependent LLM class oxidoreductase [Pseudonocardia ailaonensis]|uniref:TIGR03619 family F420-dependent LLM class oxidoreductase n=1 Tax=Pseudonocardia ailaonensis TaxID=367279 RepID=A0ABN2MYH6_9PSEU